MDGNQVRGNIQPKDGKFIARASGPFQSGAVAEFDTVEAAMVWAERQAQEYAGVRDRMTAR